MPGLGDAFIHISEVTAVVENHVPLMELKIADPRPEDTSSARPLPIWLPDGATIQLGIGNVPQRRCTVPHGPQGPRDPHRDVHGGDGQISSRPEWQTGGGKRSTRKHVFTTAAGTKRMYEFMDDNPSHRAYPASHVCSPAVIARNPTMISINSGTGGRFAWSGQCRAPGRGDLQGTGGQLDFVRGTFASKGGKSFLAFYATAKSGTICRVVPQLPPGAVVIPRAAPITSQPSLVW